MPRFEIQPAVSPDRRSIVLVPGQIPLMTPTGASSDCSKRRPQSSGIHRTGG